MTKGCKFPTLRAAALRSFAASQMQARATLAQVRAQAWRNRLKLTDYEDSAEAREEQAIADIYDEIFEYNRRLKAAEEEGKEWEDDPNDDPEPTLEDFRNLWRASQS